MQHPVIENLLRQLGVEGVVPSPGGEYDVVFDGDLDVQILPFEGSHVLIRSRIASAPDGDPAARDFFAGLLNRNLANLRRQSEIVTFEREQRTVWLYRLARVNADRNEDGTLLSIVEEFLDSLEWWRATADERPAPASNPFAFLRP